MVKNRLDYKFPSGIENEIEKPLRRKFRSERKIPTWVWFVLVALFAMTALYIEAGKMVDYQAKQALELKKAQAAEYYYWCEDHPLPKRMEGTSAEETYNQICNQIQ